MKHENMNRLKSIAVFCGASDGLGNDYLRTAFDTGKLLAENGINLVYGGGRIGLMGAVANGALSAGGVVTGVIPDFLQTKEIAHEGVTEMIVVKTMHERKMKMHELSDGIMTLPGGFGTMEELFEMLTWAQLGLHRKPIGLLNINGYYDALHHLVTTMQQQGFLKEGYASLLIGNENPEMLLDAMQRYEAPTVAPLLTSDRT